ncbi:peptidylprolyl isomerase fpr3 [Coemansia sp. RSA 552]|nr:peptidylprolyl isomerase fpr3 [Coemansia sp. RSA 552]
MLRGFWGLRIAPGKTYSQTVDASFRLSNAALGVSAEDSGRTSVLLTVDDKDFVLCSLTPGKIEQQMLDIVLTEGEEITFETNGNNEIHLAGNFVDDEPEESDIEDSDDEDEVDLEDFSIEELQELVKEGLISPDKLMALGEDEEDLDYDSDDAETDGRIREVTEEEEALMVEEAEPEPPVKEIKIKKQAKKEQQAEKKRKAAEEAAVEAEKEAAPAKSKKAKKAEKAAAEKAAAEKPAKAEKTAKAEKPAAEKPAAEKPAAEKPAKADKKLAGGVVAEIKTEGAGAGVKKGQRVGMHYIGKLTNGKVFDKNVKGKPLWFHLGKGEVIKGWDVGILGMKKGGERRLTIPAPMAYGKRGAPPDIPPNATLVFDIRLVDFK